MKCLNYLREKRNYFFKLIEIKKDSNFKNTRQMTTFLRQCFD